MEPWEREQEMEGMMARTAIQLTHNKERDEAVGISTPIEKEPTILRRIPPANNERMETLWSVFKVKGLDLKKLHELKNLLAKQGDKERLEIVKRKIQKQLVTVLVTKQTNIL